MNIRFDGQVVAVTGAGHGFGRAIAETFAGAGRARVWLQPDGGRTSRRPSVSGVRPDATRRRAAAAWIARDRAADAAARSTCW